jgi:hypothetical protein
MPAPFRSTSMSRAAVGVLCATLASLAMLPVLILLAMLDVPGDEGDSWVRGALGMILVAPVLTVILAGYYAFAAMVTCFIGRWRRAGLVALAIVTTCAFAAWAAPGPGHRHELLLEASAFVLVDLLLGSGVLYLVYARRLKPVADT